MKKNNLSQTGFNLNDKYGFTFIELLIVISIVLLLGVISIGMIWNYDEKTNNTKIETDSDSLKNSFLSYYGANKIFPMPGWNNNYFKSDWIYAHSWETDVFWVHGYVTEDILPKAYLNYLPLDPKSNQFYAYGKTMTGETQFEIASVIWNNNLPVTKLDWNYPWETWPISLIREYNWPNFVKDKSKTSFPYNPDELLLTAKINSYSWSVEVNNTSLQDSQLLGERLLSWDEIKVPRWWYAEVYFSDWSNSMLWDSSTGSILVLVDMAYKKENNLATKIKLALTSWTLWTRATSLDDDSQFDVFTADASAAVRWTIFWVSKTDDTTNITVNVWSVAIAGTYITGNGDLVEAIQNDEVSKPSLTVSTSTAITNITVWQESIQVISVELWDSPKSTDISSSSALDNTNPPSSNFLNLDSLENILLELVKIESGNLYIKNREAYNWAKLYVSGTGAITGTDTGDYLKFDVNWLSWEKEIKLCKDIKVWTSTTQSCTPSMKVVLWTDMELEQETSIENPFTKTDSDSVSKCGRGEKHFDYVETDWKIQTWECIENSLEADWWDLVAYAPYDENNNFNLYKTWWTHYSSTWASFTVNDWVLTASGTSWYLKYSNLSLNGDFAVEMSVRGVNRTTWPYNLFNLLWLKAELNDSKIKINTSNIIYELNITDTNLHTILVNKTSSHISLFIDWELKEKVSHTTQISDSILTIWSIFWFSYVQQWNDIIDYVKVYKKTP